MRRTKHAILSTDSYLVLWVTVLKRLGYICLSRNDRDASNDARKVR